MKGKGEMMTYYVDLTDDLFLVEKRRHGEEAEDEEEQQWEEQRFLSNFLAASSFVAFLLSISSKF